MGISKYTRLLQQPATFKGDMLLIEAAKTISQYVLGLDVWSLIIFEIVMAKKKKEKKKQKLFKLLHYYITSITNCAKCTCIC
uniref:Uncharacterized protein n=1 Tax=Rhizophora mucronata TaxID=61149 RepID=A0A2P2NYX5_RHIMU